MAAGAGYIEFATGDILTASAANSYLASQVVMVFADASARTSAIASPQEGMVSYLKDTNAIEYYSGSAWVAVGGGGGGGGKVLQVVQGTTTTATYSSSTTLADTTLTATITPSASTSKVLVLVAQNGVQKSSANSGNGVVLNLYRGATNIAAIGAGSLYNAAAERLDSMSFGINYLDSPATTSATTYKTQFANRVSAAQVAVQDGNELSTIILMEIGA